MNDPDQQPPPNPAAAAYQDAAIRFDQLLEQVDAFEQMVTGACRSFAATIRSERNRALDDAYAIAEATRERPALELVPDPDANGSPAWLTRKQAAIKACRSLRTIDRWIAEDRLRAANGLIRPEWLDEAIDPTGASDTE